MMWFWIGLSAFCAAGVAWLFNGLVSARQLARNGWSDIDVQLRRRADLIPQLVATVKGYAAHERALFAEVTEGRARALGAGDDVGSRAGAEDHLSQGGQRLLAVAEGYPDLKADTNFRDLQSELAQTEESIEMARRFYNGAVRELNTRVASFPGNLVAGLFGFDEKTYFEMGRSASSRVSPSVSPNVDFDT